MCNACGEDGYDEWEPDAMVKLGNHINTIPPDAIPHIQHWFTMLQALYNEVQERYRRD